MKYGFFGGSFNPPTKAHIEIAKEALEKFELDGVFFVPMGNGYAKPDLIDEKYRYEMLNIICNKEKNINVEDIELNGCNPLSTIDAFKLIEKKYSNSENYYIMGADNFEKLPNWPNSQELIQNYKYIIFERDGIDINTIIDNNLMLNKYKAHIKILNLKENTSCRSGIVRKYIKENNCNKIKDYIDEDIERYIKSKKIYE